MPTHDHSPQPVLRVPGRQPLLPEVGGLLHDGCYGATAHKAAQPAGPVGHPGQRGSRRRDSGPYPGGPAQEGQGLAGVHCGRPPAQGRRAGDAGDEGPVAVPARHLAPAGEGHEPRRGQLPYHGQGHRPEDGERSDEDPPPRRRGRRPGPLAGAPGHRQPGLPDAAGRAQRRSAWQEGVRQDRCRRTLSPT